MTLTQQLEDKKKELEKLFEIRFNKDKQLEWGVAHEGILIRKSEIAILEQAIAEMQKRDKEELDLLMEIKTHQESWRWHEYPVWHDKVENKIEQLQSQQNPNQASEGVKIEASHNQHRIPKVVNVEEIQRDVNLTSTNLSADISNLLQKQRQEILDIIDKIEPEIKKDLENPLLRKDDRGIVSGTCNIIKLKIIQQLNRKNNNNA